MLNNPPVDTDPSGYSFWTKIRKPLAALVAMIAVQWAAGEVAFARAESAAAAAGADAVGAIIAGAEAQAAVLISPITMAAGGFAAGGISGGNIESAILGAFQAVASFGIGQATGHGNLPICSDHEIKYSDFCSRNGKFASKRSRFRNRPLDARALRSIPRRGEYWAPTATPFFNETTR